MVDNHDHILNGGKNEMTKRERQIAKKVRKRRRKNECNKKNKNHSNNW